MAPEVAVVVSTYRRPKLLERLLGALAEQTLSPSRWELIIVDNCSRDPNVDAVLDTLPNVVPCAAKSLRTPSNRGPAAGRNVGWRSTSAGILAFTDDDVVPMPEWLEAGLLPFENARVGVSEGRTQAPTGTDIRSLPLWTVTRVFDDPTPYFPACNIFYRRQALEEVGGFDEQLGYWGEDTALGWEVLGAGWQRSFSRTAIVTHDVEYRSLGWHLRTACLEQHAVELAARYPGFRRDAFWRPWAYRKRDAAFVSAAVCAVAGLWWRPAWFGIVPYLWIGRPSRHEPHYVRHSVELAAVDGVRSASMLMSALRHRIFVI